MCVGVERAESQQTHRGLHLAIQTANPARSTPTRSATARLRASLRKSALTNAYNTVAGAPLEVLIVLISANTISECPFGLTDL
jgi:hypothetical protein